MIVIKKSVFCVGSQERRARNENGFGSTFNVICPTQNVYYAPNRRLNNHTILRISFTPLFTYVFSK